jgi:hypothetical protein
MSSVAFNYNNWWNWEDYPNQKVAFDGPNKIIYVNEGVTTLDVQADIYSAWKEWILNSPENPLPSSYLRAITAIGGDPITDTQNVGITYFLENGWRIQPRASKTAYTLTVEGNIYTREIGETPFLFAEGVSVSLVRSNIVDLIRVEAIGVNITEQDIAAIAAASANTVWNEIIDSNRNQNAREKLRKIATKTQDLALQ